MIKRHYWDRCYLSATSVIDDRNSTVNCWGPEPSTREEVRVWTIAQIRDAFLDRSFLRSGDFILLGLFLNMYVVFAKELDVVIFQGVQSFDRMRNVVKAYLFPWAHSRVHYVGYGGHARIEGYRIRCNVMDVLSASQFKSTAHFSYIYTGCPRRKGPNFGRVFLRSNYADITQNTYIQSSMVTEILAREKCGHLWCLFTVVSVTAY